MFFGTQITRDVGKRKCEFVVQGQLTLDGTVEGVAEGSTTALIAAPCAEATNPANVGAFRDVFRFPGTFSGSVDGVPATGDLVYAGITRPGGSMSASGRIWTPDVPVRMRTASQRVCHLA